MKKILIILILVHTYIHAYDNFIDSKSEMAILRYKNDIYIRTSYDDTRDLVQMVYAFYDVEFDKNAPIEFPRTYLIPKTNQTTVNGLLVNALTIHVAGDNAAPYAYDPCSM